MIYAPGEESHGLPFDPFKSCVTPRPIGWISSRGADGVDNLAPYSQFTNVTFDPPTILFSANRGTDGRKKDSVVNAEATGVFGWNMATWDLRDEVNRSAQEVDLDVDEFGLTGLTKVEASRIPVSLVERSPVRFECRYLQTVSIDGEGIMGTADVVFGRVVAVHILDELITADGRLDILKARPIARMGYYDYTSVDSLFEMIIPGSDKMRAGLEGSAEKARD